MPPATSPNGRDGEVAPFCKAATEERAGQEEEEEDSRDEDCTFDRPALSLSLSWSWTLPRGHRFVLSTATHPLWAPLETAGIRKQLVCPWPSFRTHFQATATGSGGRTNAPWPACPPQSTLHSAGASSPAPPLQHEPVPGAPPSPRILPSGEAEPSLRPRRSCNAAEPACRRRPAGRLAAAEAGVVVGVAAAVPGRGRDEGKGRPGSATGMGWGPSCHRVQLN
jgi:hypothetical protein